MSQYASICHRRRLCGNFPPPGSPRALDGIRITTGQIRVDLSATIIFAYIFFLLELHLVLLYVLLVLLEHLARYVTMSRDVITPTDCGNCGHRYLDKGVCNDITN